MNTRAENGMYTPEMLSKLYTKYKEIPDKDAGSFADFRQIKDNAPEKIHYAV